MEHRRPRRCTAHGTEQELDIFGFFPDTHKIPITKRHTKFYNTKHSSKQENKQPKLYVYNVRQVKQLKDYVFRTILVLLMCVNLYSIYF